MLLHPGAIRSYIYNLMCFLFYFVVLYLFSVSCLFLLFPSVIALICFTCAFPPIVFKPCLRTPVLPDCLCSLHVLSHCLMFHATWDLGLLVPKRCLCSSLTSVQLVVSPENSLALPALIDSGVDESPWTLWSKRFVPGPLHSWVLQWGHSSQLSWHPGMTRTLRLCRDAVRFG